jgi:hypothetical protein
MGRYRIRSSICVMEYLDSGQQHLIYKICARSGLVGYTSR